MRVPLALAVGGTRSARRSTHFWFYVLIAFGLLVLLAPRGVRGGDPPAERRDSVEQPDPSTGVDPASVERALADVAARVSPSVVGIRAKRHYVAGAADSAAEQLVIVNGSGTIIDHGGAILTNEHVVQGASEIDVLLSNGVTLPARVFASDPRSDLAILRVNGVTPPLATFCDWSRVARGQWVVTLGNPYGLGNDGKLSVSVGVISNLDRRLPGLGDADDRLYADMIQITAPIVPGNSGGPLFNLRGELVGIVTAMHTRSADDQGVGFAIPMTPLRRQIIDRLLSGATIDYGFIGITARTPSADEAVAARLATGQGAAIESVEPDGPAARAGLRSGDILVQCDGRPIENAVQLGEQIGQTRAGSHIKLLAQRGAVPIEVALTVEQRHISRVNWMRSGAILWRGLRLANVAGSDGVGMGADPASGGVVVVDVAADSPAGRADVRVGDVIERVEQDTVEEINAFRQRVRAEQGLVRITIRGRGVLRVAPH